MHSSNFYILPSLILTISFTSFSSASPMPRPAPDAQAIYLNDCAGGNSVFCCGRVGQDLIEPVHTDGFVYGFDCRQVSSPNDCNTHLVCCNPGQWQLSPSGNDGGYAYCNPIRLAGNPQPNPTPSFYPNAPQPTPSPGW